MKAPRITHTLDVLRAELQLVDSKLKAPVEAYLIGGCAMSYLGLKDATKDLDFVLQDEGALSNLSQGLVGAGYRKTNLDRPYDQLQAKAFFAKDQAPQWDLYVRQVCGCLTLSPGMRSRATALEPDLARLRIKACSPEDIFVFKSITDREADRDDMATIIPGIKWDVVLDEMEWQRANSETVWTSLFYGRLAELEDQGFRVPILSRLEEMATEDLEKRYGSKLPP